MTATSSVRCGFPAKEPAGKAGRDAWAAADDLVLRKIAQAGLERPQRHDQWNAPDAPPAPPRTAAARRWRARNSALPASGCVQRHGCARLQRPLTDTP